MTYSIKETKDGYVIMERHGKKKHAITEPQPFVEAKRQLKQLMQQSLDDVRGRHD